MAAKRKRTKYSNLTLSQISHLKKADIWGTKEWSLSNRPNSKEFKDASKKCSYHEKMVSWQQEHREIAPKEVKKKIWDSIKD